jgi:integrator complex subunit 1
MQPVKTVINEANSQLIGQVMKYDPLSSVRQPPTETLQNLRKLNVDYKLGQMLCRSRDPDYLLILVKRQSSMLSLSWLSSLMDTNSSYLHLMPVQCICEFVWNLFNSNEDPKKSSCNLEQPFERIQAILIDDCVDDELSFQQAHDTLEYFLKKLSSDKLHVRKNALKVNGH